ncbi:peptidase s9 : Dipeptidyl aminopeptidase/acylaminoacyl peptidase OS=Singulisphaera acidiphila (strain ATCC BAA-1392 / DSM 18658 / VKM B-2454 / MOB10) GN=Sinac_6999 PE=4 SV=1: DPPIV_N: Peptidase_S9 [Gemmataceae bacterium]|nr:peptidase s9 : Dipeptidyl aminopeptidase/acylaminoacyl peptidase OS=Singulisphaera acidiphila (strain ATCC BAA-1392 / DSM 18658 / VKM B-2454 / MOB10) GN=Sinac_6999 PE=4 SV=1: DPPIV_N: Peptidase_S9 [Gemmataceae bacterium]VTU02290.1 peptidase s9 : Dipeptidyl aminopeptidase/acylaminoacyl peptidase OS=Singulisphaera acidiphila (strain ATCC BAA-1392 / DSM 18658 / VKM B-2454 / MOB10) GN=Sinac_6999 PE=4 SV=1: DPPIV_N: Peptidase_S9 [Gemmataceae bacterium]
MTRRTAALALLALASLAPPTLAQGTRADYERANTVREWTAGKVFKARVDPHWFDNGDKFWYRNDLPGGKKEFVIVDAVKGTREVVTEDKLPKEGRPAKPAARGEADAAEVIAAQQPRRGADSPDGAWTAVTKDHNVWLRDRATKKETQLSTDGKPDDSYGRVFWAPDSKRLVAIRTRAGGDRKVTLVESSPKDQLQPKTSTYSYLKPGDPVPQPKPHLFDVAAGKEIAVSDELFANPWDVTHEHWSTDGSRFHFVYNQRGHRVVRLLAIDAETGKVTAVVNEECKTFFDYAYKLHVHYLDGTDEAVWMSERSGWNHLYLVDLKTGAAKPITSGEWVVRGVDRVDEKERQVWFRAGGAHPSQDPYHVHFCRAKLDGTGLTHLTEGDGTHTVAFSLDRRFLIDTFSRVDLPPVTELRRVADGTKVCDLEAADASALLKTGWRFPERFTAKGRDGTTDIHGYIVRPSTFDPKKTYPVVEHIYAGPHDHHVRKAFSAAPYEQRVAELGFVVVKIDGMGTNWRSKAFHDVCWKNLGDSGFPDRIAWIRAAAATRPEMDVAKGVGIFGGSAGGQSSTRALLAHGDFYTVAVSDCGCHDNRMDKVWWNEAWMSWPVGPHYAEQSNVTHAHKLKGKLLLIVGELDRNVDPASTMQVANALVRADRDFDLLVIPGAGHGAAETPYGTRRRADYLVRHLLGVEPRAK